jgi:hypothetical protein
MKKIIVLLLIFLPIIGFSQDLLTYKSGGRIYNQTNQKLSSDEVRSLMAQNSEGLKLYNAGKSKQTVGNIMLYGGISTVAINHYSILQNAKNKGAINSDRNIPYIIGAGLILTAIPIKIGFSKKIKKAVNLINEDIKNPKNGFNIESTNFISNSNGVGISLTF